MDRLIHTHLLEWKLNESRKPLILRGARQVGKTTSVRKLGELFEHYVEVNFEKLLSVHSIFSQDLDPHRIIQDLQLLLNVRIEEGKTLLFLDEIQACPRALLALRYFYEGIPNLHVVAAGSLLDFAIDEIGLPVGRISHLYVYPMTFIEFLWAQEERRLASLICNQTAKLAISASIHTKLLRLLGEYIAIGGMPEAVKSWRDHKSYQQCLSIHRELISAYGQDFQKYAKGAQVKYVDLLFQQIPSQIGQSFQFHRVESDLRKRELKPALELLHKAGIVHPIYHTAAQGTPLGAQKNPEKFKLILLDIALSQAQLGITSEQYILTPETSIINKGGIAEAFVGQELLAYAAPNQSDPLYFWQREKRNSQSEVDYVVDIQGSIIPIEVKSGKGSTLKSMHKFLEEHPKSPFGIRYSTQNYSILDNIHSYPLYAVAQQILKHD